jgi:predicted site-specific integrase-resolvase
MPESRESVRRPSRRLRCAIYTRKSSDEGLEQAFNSLDAQREACAAFVLSQKHEGWSVLPTFYDDGGYSGGTLDRPALQRLLADIADAKVDVVVVYKIDRLTRSLFDFAKIVEAFDARGVSFVSITQQFNTTTSMGRLTLNVLLSFAQFEREVSGEQAGILSVYSVSPVDSVLGQDSLDLVPKGLVHDGLMLSGIGITLVRDLAAINAVLQHKIESAAGEFVTAIVSSVREGAALAADPRSIEFGLKGTH